MSTNAEAESSRREAYAADDQPLLRDRAYRGLLATQFFGAFNDNVFKQMLLLLCLDYKKIWGLSTDRFQPIATALFTASFLAFSGLAGYLSDRYRKRRIIVISKQAEIAVMALGLLVLLIFPIGTAALLWTLMAVLTLMGSQSAFFGPSKYGVLPEILRSSDLPAANGWIQMTTFLAIIFGIAVAGTMKDAVGDQLWLIAVFCVAIAAVGTYTATWLRDPPVAQPDLRFSASCLLVEKQAWQLLRRDRLLGPVLLVYSVFWFAGGVVLPTVNEIGKSQFGWNDGPTSLVNASLAIGIGLGCAVSGIVSQKRISFGLVRWGAGGTGAAFILAALVAAAAQSDLARGILLSLALLLAGGCAGLMAVPLQVFLQARPPAHLKGRVIGAMNLFTWIGVLLSTVFYYISHAALSAAQLPPSWILALLSVFMLAIAFGFRRRPDEPPPGA